MTIGPSAALHDTAAWLAIGPLIAAGPRPMIPAVVGELVAGAILGRSDGQIASSVRSAAVAFLVVLAIAIPAR